MKFTVAIRPKGSSGKAKIDEVQAPSEAALGQLLGKMGFEIVEVIDRIDDKALNVIDNMDTNQLLHMAGKKADFEAARARAQQPPQQQPQPNVPQAQHPAPQQQQPAPQQEIVFKDDSSGIEYKVVDGDVFKKAWVEQEAKDFRVIKKTKSSEKILGADEITIEKLDWVKVEKREV